MEFASATVHKSGNSLHVTHGDDHELYVEFYMEPVHQEFASSEAGRPIYKDTPYIHIMFPGDRTKEIKRPVNETDKERFHKQWLRFENQLEQAPEGTPIEEWPMISRSDALNLKAVRIHTVEQLAAVADSNLANIGLGAREFREKARAWLSRAQDGADISRLHAENERLKTDLEALKKQIAEIGKRKAKD